MGNICRSPAAECVFRTMAEEFTDKIEVDVGSAGTINFHEGNSPDKRMQSAGAKRGYSISGAARQIVENDFFEFDLIVPMDASNLSYVNQIAPTKPHRAEVKLFCDFCTDRSESEVPDPYYGGQDGFDLVLDILENGCKEILKSIT